MSGTFSTNIMPQTATPIINTTDGINGVKSYRYLAELASNAMDDEEIPMDFKVVDVMVAEPSEAAILELLGEKGWLKNWGLVSFWQEVDGDEF